MILRHMPYDLCDKALISELSFNTHISKHEYFKSNIEKIRKLNKLNYTMFCAVWDTMEDRISDVQVNQLKILLGA